MPAFIWGLPKREYSFIETAFQIVLPKEKYVVPPFVARLDRGVSVSLVTVPTEVDAVLAHIKENIFDTDRVSIDPFFTGEQSAHRYFSWTQDMIHSNCGLYTVAIKGHDIGFFIIKQINETTAYPVLTGLYPAYKGKGVGSLLLKKCIDTVWDRGFGRIESWIVSNNWEILKVDQAFGFTIAALQYVYVKHLPSSRQSAVTAKG